MQTAVTAFSGRAGRMIRAGTATLAASVVVIATTAVTGLVPAASATGDGDHDVTMRLASDTTQELTDGRNFIRAIGAADKDGWGGTVVLSFPLRTGDRLGHDGDSVVALAGGVAYTGAGPDMTWTRLRVNFETHRITARINGGPRVAILRVGSHDGFRASWGDSDAGLRLTTAGARSLNRAAAGTPFSAGDVFAGDSSGCS